MKDKKDSRNKCVNCKRKDGKKRRLRFREYQLNKMDIILCDICYKKIKQDWMTTQIENNKTKIKIQKYPPKNQDMIRTTINETNTKTVKCKKCGTRIKKKGPSKKCFVCGKWV